MPTVINLTPPPTPMPTYVLPEGLGLNPIWDQNIYMGIPLWMWFGVVLGIIFACVGIRWLFRMTRMAAVAGYKDVVNSTDANAVQVWYFGITGSFAIFCLTLKERVLTYLDTVKNLDKWLITSVYSRGSCGNVPMIWVRGTSELAIDPPSEKAIAVLARSFNNKWAWDDKANPEYLTYDDDKGKKQFVLNDDGEPIQKIIRNFDDYLFFLPLIERLNPDGIDVPAYSFFDAGESQEFTDRDSTAEFFGARRLFAARELRMQMPDKGFLDKYGLLILVCLALVIGTGLSYAAVMSG